MKKFYALFLALGLTFTLAACGSTEDVSTGASKEKESTSTKTQSKNKKDDGSKKINASKHKTTAQGMKVNLGEIKIMKDKINVGMNIENTTDKVLNFYPDQGKVVAGSMQLDANMFMTDGDIGGEVEGGVKQDGVIQFLAPEGKEINIKNIKELKLKFGDVTTDDYMNSKDVTFTVKVK
ncbi:MULTISPECIES: lipoprotein [Bacillus]|uniref:LptM family lipoprotein n=1 Tax=Bacillus TaxID=1386 RepID=UPI00097755E7|nr:MULTISPECIES: hypothetical protein [Bacillus]MBL4987260.1 hypothetical protein [Bacillus safensis]OMP26128.1 hypothetical protein BAE31_15415 [Bacillus sp. I-2]WLW70122.1 hypothetical protein RA177_03020 [Bacillus safensis]